jgi:16S rRNA processing protein RimM
VSGTRILMGVIGKPHGVHGLLHVRAYAADPDSLAAAKLQDDQGRIWSLAWRSLGLAELRDAAGRPVADRTAAEKLVNTRLYVDRADLPPPEDDEFYLADLIGLAAVTETGASVGRVATVHDYGAGVSLEIERPAAAPLLVPFTKLAVPTVDLASGRLIIVPPHEIEAKDAAA